MSQVLLIEAEASDRLVLKSRLQELGHKVTSVETGAKGIVEARNGVFDLIMISAEGKGGIEGCEVVKRIKAIPTGVSTPIVIYSNNKGGADLAETAYAAGGDAFVPKAQMPYIHLVLDAQLRHAGRNRAAHEETRILEKRVRQLEEERSQSISVTGQLDPETGTAVAMHELACGRPDGILVVDGSGHVQHADRGGLELMGRSVIGQALGKAAPATSLEAYVRDARTHSRDGFRFEVSARKDRVQRSLMATVVPVTRNDAGGQALRVVLLLDMGKRKVAEELLRAHEPGIPRQHLAELLTHAQNLFTLEAITGKGEASARFREQVGQWIPKSHPVLLSGEKGTGKRYAANVLHYSSQSTGPILSVRCGAQSDQELELELFGYAKGSHDGAVADHPGLFLLAQDGSLLLEDADRLSQPLQKRIAEAMQKRQLMRKGGRAPERFELRLLATTTLPEEEFNRSADPDFAHQFHTGVIQVPSLNERREDLPLFVEFFLERYGPLHRVFEVSNEASYYLEQYDWPGNVGELEAAIDEACAAANGGPIEVDHLPQPLRQLAATLPSNDLIPSPEWKEMGELVGAGGPGRTTLHERQPWDISEDDPISLEHYEMKALLRALNSCSGDKLAAARLLKVGKSTLYRKLKRFGIS